MEINKAFITYFNASQHQKLHFLYKQIHIKQICRLLNSEIRNILEKY